MRTVEDKSYASVSMKTDNYGFVTTCMRCDRTETGLKDEADIRRWLEQHPCEEEAA